ncbi:MAG: molybdate ABC transporter substrate-binding protein [Clostridiales bacterium]|nr:molybdate ABC transporter substrate-binding protein [Clostridiales bacterium]
MKKITAILMTICMSAFVFGCSAETSETSAAAAGNKTINILAAASLTDVMHELELDYEADHPGIDLVFSFASSGALQTQIEEGAPADVFISAASKQMDALNEEGLMDSASIRDLLLNRVVLIVPNGSELGLTSFGDVINEGVNIIALGDVESVPAGKYAQQVFESLGIWDEVEAGANFGTDVRTVLTWVEMGEADCGVVYATDAYTSDQVTIVAEAPEGSCDRVVYPAGIVAGSAVSAEAEEFLQYLESADAAAVFESYGFTMAG